MPMFKHSCVVLLLIGSSACGAKSPTAPTNFTITVSSLDTNVLFSATEQDRRSIGRAGADGHMER
jgi:hypothetical protein